MAALALLLLSGTGSAAAAGSAAGSAAAAPLRPNIIFNLVDDLGWNDVSWHREGLGIRPWTLKL
jgi:hypothetical protein